MATPEEREAIRQASLKEHGFPPSGTCPPRDPALNPASPEAWRDTFEDNAHFLQSGAHDIADLEPS